MSLRKEYFAAVVPAVLAFALSAVYAIVDGFFVGNTVGDVGISAINVVYPLVALIQALGTGVGMGGAVVWSIKKVTASKEEANQVVLSTLLLLALLSALCMAGLWALLEPALWFLGARGDVVAFGRDYLQVVIGGAGFQIFAVGLVPLLRNNGGARFAMMTMMAGFVTNIGLDYAFVWVLNGGMTGAAAATVAGQLVTVLCCVGYLVRHRLPRWQRPVGVARLWGALVRIGIAPFGLSLSPMISLMLMNRFSLAYGGNAAVACYACIAYALTIVYCLLQGVGDGSQPLFSRCYAEGKYKELAQVQRWAVALGEGLAVFGIALLFFGRFGVGRLLGASAGVTADVAGALPIFLLGLFFYAYSRVATAGFYATERSTDSYLCVYAEPVSLLVLLLIVPRFSGQAGVWWSMVGAQAFTGGLAFYLRRRAAGQEKEKSK